jgi:hypothetical protein
MKIIRQLTLRVATLFLFASLAVATSIAQQPRSGSISGRVIVDAGVPMERVTIRLTSQVRDAAGQPLARATNPDGEGRFVFNGLPPRSYIISAFAPGYISKRDAVAGSGYVRLGETAIIELIKGGVITGRVIDRRGEGMVMTRVSAIRVRDEADNSISPLMAGSGGMTDDRGIYRLYGLPAGSYIVGVNMYRLSTDPAAQEGDAPVFHPSSGRANASEVRVTAGGEVSGIDIGYRRESGRVISGTVELDDTGANPIGINVGIREYPSNIIIASTYLRNLLTDRQFTLRGVMDGEYVLTASGQRGTYPEIPSISSDSQRITVRGGDLTGIKLTIKRHGGIGGTVMIEPVRPPQPPACKQALAGVVDEVIVSAASASNNKPVINIFSSSVAVDRNQFILSNLTAGQYHLLFNLPGDHWYPRMIIAPAPGRGARRIVDLGANPLNVNVGETLGGITVTLAEGAASLSGRVDVTNGRARIHLIPAEPQAANQLLRYAEVVSDREGRFQLRHLVPGRYYAIAVNISEQSTSPAQPPKAWNEAERVELRRLAEAAKKEIELQPCQRMVDYQLNPISVKK